MPKDEEVAARLDRSVNRLAKWRSFFAGWMFGSTPKDHGPSRAFKNEVEARLILRAEVNAISKILIDLQITTLAALSAAVADEADALSEALSRSYPGWSPSDDGMVMHMPEAYTTMQRLGFPG